MIPNELISITLFVLKANIGISDAVYQLHRTLFTRIVRTEMSLPPKKIDSTVFEVVPK